MEDKYRANAGAEAEAEAMDKEDAGYEIPVEDAAPDPEVIAEDAADAEETAGAQADPDGEAGKEQKEGSKAMRERVEALEDRVKRQMAEFDNFRKRTDREKEQMFSMGEKSVIEKMLPVVDNFERGLAAIPEDEKAGAVASGMEMIYKQLIKQLLDLGVKPIDAVGKPFDPNFHNAVMQVQSDEYESGVIAQEFQKGYLYHDTVIRHSMVGVAE
ncbi:MAG: nucleotide exchange factor GrpE [Eubacteriales bacterium]|nr:nucleotide exchange factor GrpE [Eubacteriales bacterium]